MILNKLKFIVTYLINDRLRKDVKSIKIADKGYTYYAYTLCKKVGIIDELSNPKDLDTISKKLKLKNKKMLEALLGYLVGKNIINYQKGTYAFSGLIPSDFSESEQKFISQHYPGSEEWTLTLYGFAENCLKNSKTYDQTGFNDGKMIELWDSVLTGPLYSFRLEAIKKLISNLKDGSKIVILGCGSGTEIEDIFNKSDKEIQIIGVDSSAAMINKCKTRFSKNYEKNNKTDFKVLDLSKDFSLGTGYDAAFLSVVVHHLPEEQREQLYKKVSKMLRPNGRFVLFQLVNRSKFDRIFSDWLLYVVPSHNGFPILEQYQKELSRYFSKIDLEFNGMITVAQK